MADDFPDLHHKLCKKLAHLTSIFYHLNIKNDENDLIIQNTIECYEQEMDNIVQTANDIIDKHIKENTQALELHKIHDAYKEFKQTVEKERISSIVEFNALRGTIEDRERDIRKEAQDQVDLCQKEVEGLREKLKHMQKIVEKAVGIEIQYDDEEQKAKEEQEKRIKLELEEKTREMGEMKMKYLELERMYKDLEEGHLGSDKRSLNPWSRGLLGDDGESYNTAILRSGEWEIESLRKRVIEQEKMIYALKKALGHETGLESENNASVEFGMTSNAEVSTTSVQQVQVHDFQREAKLVREAAEQMVREKDQEIEKLKERLLESGSDEKFQKKIEEYENRLKEASKEHRKMIETLHNEYNENMTEMEAQFEIEKRRWESMLQGMQATLESRGEYIIGLEEQLRLLDEQNKADSQGREELLGQEISRLNRLLEETGISYEEKLTAQKVQAEEDKQNMIKELKKEKEKSLKDLREQLAKEVSALEAEKDAKIKELEAEIEELSKIPTSRQNLEDRIKEMAEEYQTKVNELSQRHNQNLREVIEKHEDKENRARERYEKEINGLQKELEREKENVLKMKEDDKNSEVQRVKNEYEAKLQKISKSYDQQLEEKLNEYEAKLKVKDVEIEDFRKEIEIVKQQLTDELEKLKEKEVKYKELEKIVEDQKNTIEVLKDEGQEKIFEEGEESSTFRAELLKAQQGAYKEKEKEEIIKDHLKYAELIEKKYKLLKQNNDEKVQLLMDKYTELYNAFENRPSKEEDLALIKQLQDSLGGKEEEMNRMSEKLKVSQVESTKKESFSRAFNSQPIIHPNSLMSTGTGDKSKKSSKHMSPGHITSLPPISISQFSIQFKTPAAPSSTLAAKKFFK